MTDKSDNQGRVANQPNPSNLARLLVANLKTPMSPNMAVFMRAFILGSLLSHRDTGTPIPRLDLDSLIEALEAVQAGHTSDLLVPTGREHRGSPRRHPLENICIDIAIGYRLSVEVGLVEDAAPIKTIQQAFGGTDPMAGGLDSGTIRKWANERRDRLEPLAGPNATALLGLAGFVYSSQFNRKARAQRGRRR